MYKWVMFVLFLAASVIGIGFLFNQVNIHAKENAPDTSGVPKLTLVATNFQFDQPEYTVTKGEKMKVSLSIKEGIHEVAIPELNVKLDKANPSQEITFDKPGTFTIECVLACGPGHDGMKSKLVVQ